MEGDAFVVDVTIEVVEVEPPQLFDLTTLQRVANSRYGLTAAETLNCAQSLYEDGAISYPRTSNHFITPDMVQTVSEMLSDEDSAEVGSTASLDNESTLGGSFSGTKSESCENKTNIPDSEVPSAVMTESYVVVQDNLTIHNTEQTISGVEFVGEQKEANEFFRGDQFSIKDSYEGSIDQVRKAEIINANASTTCDLNTNLDGVLENNDKSVGQMSDVQKAFVKELMEMRETIPLITEDTVMQKVISEDQLKEYIRADDPKIQVSGCASKAVDVVPYTSNIRQAYETLRLDYIGTPYKDLAEKKGDMYVMRFTSDYCPGNSAYPKMDGTEPWNKPPCTGTGYTGSKEHLVPEYTYGRGQEISDGVIYIVDYNGNETMVAIWNHGRFEKVE